MIFKVLTLFPSLIENYINTSIIKKAIEKDKINIEIIDIRDFSNLRHNQVDDYQFGGGSGMVMMIEPVVSALNSVKTNDSYVILTSPQGKVFNQEKAKLLSKQKEIIIICGHYEGIDSRINNYINEEVSIGDYVLTGGELASLVLIDSISRMVDGVIKQESYKNDSFYDRFLDHDVYSKPVEFEGLKVPDVLLSGHHANIESWKQSSRIANTYNKRSDIFSKIKLSDEEKLILEKIKKEK